MANKTDYLKLDKPNVNSNNWGAAINNNFELIDANAKSTKNSIKRIQNTLGEANMIGFDENFQYISFTQDGRVILYATATSEGVEYYNHSTGTDNLSAFADYTGFYIKTDYVAPTTVDVSLPDFFQHNWYIGEIAVKNTVWDEIEITNTIDFIKFKQSLGGWYLPILVGQDKDGNITNTITWEKKFAGTAEKETTTVIPFRTLNSPVFVQEFNGCAANQNFSSTDFTTFCNQLFSDNNTRNLFIDFYTGTAGITPISVDYIVLFSSTNKTISIRFNAEVTEKFTMRARIMGEE